MPGFTIVKILDAGAGNFIANDRYVNRFVPAFAAQRDVDRGALGTLQHVGYFGGRESGAGFAIDFEDDVARTNAGLVGGRADEGREHDRLVIRCADRHADAVILALLLFAE